MKALFEKLLLFSKSKISIQNQLKKKKLVDKVKAIIDQKKSETKSNIHSGVDSARLWMEEFTGLDKVHATQSEVVNFQNKFIQSQATRRELGTKLSALQTELNELHNDIMSTNRSDEKYLQLITREHKLLKLEKQFRNDFSLKEAEERENFTLFTTKIKESQDKEKEQALRTKYWTIIVSSAVTVIGVVGNGVISFLKMHKMDKTIALLGDETKSLNRNIHDNITQLDTSQTQVITLLAQIAVKLGAGNRVESSVETEKQSEISNAVEIVRQTNKKMENLHRAQQAKTDENYNRLDANQAMTLQLLKQIYGELETMKRNYSKDSASKEKTYKETDGVSSSRTNTYDRLSSLGANTKERFSGFVESYRNGSGVFSEEAEDSSEVETSWTRKVVYFSVVTCVLILLGRGVI